MLTKDCSREKCFLDFSSKIDIWSLGCVAIEMISNKLPWDGCEPCHVLFALGSGMARPAFPENISPELYDFIDQCLQIDPKCRPSAVDLLAHKFLKKDLE